MCLIFWKNFVNQYKDDLGFSITTIRPLSWANKTTFARKLYNLFAERTRFKLVCFRFGKPSGNFEDLKGMGPVMTCPFEFLILMLRAKLHVPHGGAAKIPARFGDVIQVIKRVCPALVVRSATIIGAIELSFLWSTPNAERMLAAFRAAVRRPEPANISMTMGPSLLCFLTVSLENC